MYKYDDVLISVHVCMERPVGVVTSRALLRLGAEQFCLRAFSLHNVADDDMD